MKSTSRRIPIVIVVGAVSWDGARLPLPPEWFGSGPGEVEARLKNRRRYVASDDTEDVENVEQQFCKLLVATPPEQLKEATRLGARYLFVCGSPSYLASWMATGHVDRLALLHVPVIVGSVAHAGATEGVGGEGKELIAPFQPPNHQPRLIFQLKRTRNYCAREQSEQPGLFTYHTRAR